MKSFTCLIVDDEEDICEVCNMYLDNMGKFRQILTAKDGVDASIKMTNQAFDLILLDINLPKRGGLDILNAQKKEKGSVDNIAVMSGSIDKDTLSEAVKCGVTSFIVKPFTEAQFQEKVISILKKVIKK